MVGLGKVCISVLGPILAEFLEGYWGELHDTGDRNPGDGSCGIHDHIHCLAEDIQYLIQESHGKYAATLIAFGLCNASLFAACILPLSTAFYICEGMGWESVVDHDFRRAPQFFWLFTIIIVISALIILIPNAPLIAIMYLSQVVNGAVLPFVLIFMLRLINNRQIMGSYVNGQVLNAIAWSPW